MGRSLFTIFVLIIIFAVIIVPGECVVEPCRGSYDIYHPADIIPEQADNPVNGPVDDTDAFVQKAESDRSLITIAVLKDYTAVGMFFLSSLALILLLSFFYSNRLKRTENMLTELLEERDLFIKGINHRIKNNLAIINSMISMQILNSDEEETRQKLTAISNRIMSMSVVHDNLLQSKNVSKINIYNICVCLGERLIQIYCMGLVIEFSVKGEEFLIDFDKAVPLSMVMNEIISNSLKFAFKGRAGGRISVEYTCSEDIFEMIVSDDGIGIPEHVMNESRESIGLNLIRNLVSLQLEGNAELRIESGTKWLISFHVKCC